MEISTFWSLSIENCTFFSLSYWNLYLLKLFYWDCWSLVRDHAQGCERIIITLLKVKAHTTLEFPRDPSLTAGTAAADKEARMCAKSAQARKIAVHQPFISQAVSLQVHIIASLATRTLHRIPCWVMFRVLEDECFLFKSCCCIPQARIRTKSRLCTGCGGQSGPILPLGAFESSFFGAWFCSP